MTNRKIALVTGGGQGIGLAVAQRLTESGMHCVIFDNNEKNRESARSATRGAGDEADFMVVDVTDAAVVAEAVADIAEEHGMIDVVVTSAGVALHMPSLDVTPEQWRRVFDVNTHGSFWCVREAARAMITAGKPGSIVLIGSMSGDIANYPQAQTAYNASKGAVHVMTKCLAVEWASTGIRVNAVAPGYVGTDLTRQGINPDWIEEWERRTPQGRACGRCPS